MKRKFWVIIIIAIFIISSACAALDFTSQFWAPETDEINLSDNSVDGENAQSGGADEKEDQSADTSDEEGNDEAASDQPESGEPTSLSDIDKHLENIDKFLASLTVDQISAVNVDIMPGNEGDNIHGSGLVPGGSFSAADIVWTGQTTLSFEENITIEDLIDCTLDNPHINLKVFCSQDREPETSNQYLFIWFATMETIPTYDPSLSMSLFWGFDSDGDPKNDFVASELNPLDFWQGLDRTHVVDYSPQVGWSYSIFADLGSGFVPVQSNAIMILQDNFFGILGSEQEFNFKEISSNGGVHIHNGTWSLESTAANTAWTGDPIAGPVGFNTNSILHLNVDPDLFLLNLTDGSVLCDTDKCSLVYHPEENSDQKSFYACECKGCTSIEDCFCAIYTQPSYPREGNQEWSMGIGDKIFEPDENSRYKCYCIHKEE